MGFWKDKAMSVVIVSCFNGCGCGKKKGLSPSPPLRVSCLFLLLVYLPAPLAYRLAKTLKRHTHAHPPGTGNGNRPEQRRTQKSRNQGGDRASASRSRDRASGAGGHSRLEGGEWRMAEWHGIGFLHDKKGTITKDERPARRARAHISPLALLHSCLHLHHASASALTPSHAPSMMNWTTCASFPSAVPSSCSSLTCPTLTPSRPPPFLRLKT